MFEGNVRGSDMVTFFEAVKVRVNQIKDHFGYCFIIAYYAGHGGSYYGNQEIITSDGFGYPLFHNL